MRVLLINTSERIGGAAVACSRLMEALKNNGVKAKMLVRDKQTESLTVVPLPQGRRRMQWKFLRERLTIWMANRFRRDNLFSVDIAQTGADITRLPEFQEADIIHLHWVNQGMLSLRQLERILASGKRVVWTMHDMWPCTAICHHARQCVRYQEPDGCHHCPYLYGGGSANDLSARLFRRKQELYRGRSVRFVACSEWLASLARRSRLLEGQSVTAIPNPLNTALFAPDNRQEARRRLELPTDRRLILFGSVKTTDKRKGIDYLVEACRLLAGQRPELRDRWAIVIAGGRSEELQHLFPFPVHTLGFTTDEHRMADIYRAADLFVTPSLEENLPNTLMEAMACGTPCVGFRTGGIPEMIDHEANGYVARYRDAEDLAAGILYTLDESRHDALSEAARRKAVTHYSERAIAQRYIELYGNFSF